MLKIMPTKTTTKKTAAVATARKPAAKKPAAPKTKKAPPYSQDDVALRAYFISEKRRKLGLPGDSHSDWIEAERQLATEHRPKSNGKKP